MTILERIAIRNATHGQPTLRHNERVLTLLTATRALVGHDAGEPELVAFETALAGFDIGKGSGDMFRGSDGVAYVGRYVCADPHAAAIIAACETELAGGNAWVAMAEAIAAFTEHDDAYAFAEQARVDEGIVG